MNPYTSSGSVATMTANVSGNDSLNDLGDGPRQPGDPERYPVGAVTRRLLAMFARTAFRLQRRS